MTLIISDPNHKATPKFISFIIQQIKIKFVHELRADRFNLVYSYLIEKELIPKEITPKRLLREILSHFQSWSSREYVYIGVNPHYIIPNTRIKLVVICKLLNFGNMEIRGSWIFSKVFEQISYKINSYYRLFAFVQP